MDHHAQLSKLLAAFGIPISKVTAEDSSLLDSQGRKNIVAFPTAISIFLLEESQKQDDINPNILISLPSVGPSFDTTDQPSSIPDPREKKSYSIKFYERNIIVTILLENIDAKAMFDQLTIEYILQFFLETFAKIRKNTIKHVIVTINPRSNFKIAQNGISFSLNCEFEIENFSKNDIKSHETIRSLIMGPFINKNIQLKQLLQAYGIPPVKVFVKNEVYQKDRGSGDTSSLSPTSSLPPKYAYHKPHAASDNMLFNLSREPRWSPTTRNSKWSPLGTPSTYPTKISSFNPFNQLSSLPSLNPISTPLSSPSLKPSIKQSVSPSKKPSGNLVNNPSNSLSKNTINNTK